MTNEYDVMPFDATLLSEVLTHHNVSAKAVAARAGYDLTSIYRYLSGERTIPSTVIRAAFELTHDPRLVELVSGTVAVQVIKPQLINIPPIEELMAQTAEAAKSAVDALAYVGRMIADGRIDAGDAHAIANFRRHSADCRRLMSVCDAAVTAHFQSASGGKQ